MGPSQTVNTALLSEAINTGKPLSAGEPIPPPIDHVDYRRRHGHAVKVVCEQMWARLDGEQIEVRNAVQEPKARRAPAPKVNHAARYRQLKRNKLKTA